MHLLKPCHSIGRPRIRYSRFIQSACYSHRPDAGASADDPHVRLPLGGCIYQPLCAVERDPDHVWPLCSQGICTGGASGPSCRFHFCCPAVRHAVYPSHRLCHRGRCAFRVRLWLWADYMARQVRQGDNGLGAPRDVFRVLDARHRQVRVSPSPVASVHRERQGSGARRQRSVCARFLGRLRRARGAPRHRIQRRGARRALNIAERADAGDCRTGRTETGAFGACGEIGWRSCE